MVIQISAALAAVCFAALVVYLIRTLRTVDDTLQKANRLIDDTKVQLGEWNEEVQRIVRAGEDVIGDAQTKLRTLNPLFETAQDIGLALHDVTASLRHVSAAAAQAIARGSRHAEKLENSESAFLRGIRLLAAAVRMVR